MGAFMNEGITSVIDAERGKLVKPGGAESYPIWCFQRFGYMYLARRILGVPARKSQSTSLRTFQVRRYLCQSAMDRLTRLRGIGPKIGSQVAVENEFVFGNGREEPVQGCPHHPRALYGCNCDRFRRLALALHQYADVRLFSLYRGDARDSGTLLDYMCQLVGEQATP